MAYYLEVTELLFLKHFNGYSPAELLMGRKLRTTVHDLLSQSYLVGESSPSSYAVQTPNGQF